MTTSTQGIGLFSGAQTTGMDPLGSDNMTALAMIASLKSKGPALATIARELALDFASATYAPDIIQHSPGIMNSSSDALSRRFEPGKNYVIPHILRSCTEVFPQPRDSKFWKTWGYW